LHLSSALLVELVKFVSRKVPAIKSRRDWSLFLDKKGCL
jgi:hypothetical protein